MKNSDWLIARESWWRGFAVGALSVMFMMLVFYLLIEP